MRCSVKIHTWYQVPGTACLYFIIIQKQYKTESLKLGWRYVHLRHERHEAAPRHRHDREAQLQVSRISTTPPCVFSPPCLNVRVQVLSTRYSLYSSTPGYDRIRSYQRYTAESTQALRCPGGVRRPLRLLRRCMLDCRCKNWRLENAQSPAAMLQENNPQRPRIPRMYIRGILLY